MLIANLTESRLPWVMNLLGMPADDHDRLHWGESIHSPWWHHALAGTVDCKNAERNWAAAFIHCLGLLPGHVMWLGSSMHSLPWAPAWACHVTSYFKVLPPDSLSWWTLEQWAKIKPSLLKLPLSELFIRATGKETKTCIVLKCILKPVRPSAPLLVPQTFPKL